MVKRLTEQAIKNAKPKDKPYTISDGVGLLLEIRPNGVKNWVVRYFTKTEDGKRKENRKSVGNYRMERDPEQEGYVTTDEARAYALKIKELAKKNYPINNKVIATEDTTFGHFCGEWYKERMSDKAEAHKKTTLYRINKHILPILKNIELRNITSQLIRDICRNIQNDQTDEKTGAIIKTGSPSTARRIKQIIGQVFRFADATGHAIDDPTQKLKGVLKPYTEKHFAIIQKDPEIKKLVNAIAVYPFRVVRFALIFSLLTFCRPGEIRHAEWAEFDFADKLWTIPAKKMKMRDVHTVPLCPFTLDVLYTLKKYTGEQKWLFPSAREDGRPMSDGTVNMALRAIGYIKGDITAHGFRGTAGTRLADAGYREDFIDIQLSHKFRTGSRKPYIHSDYLPERIDMMNWWGDHLWGLMDAENQKNIFLL